MSLPVRHPQPASSTDRHGTTQGTTGASAAPGPRKTLPLAALLGDAQGIDIDHNGHVYRLQITKAGKLILTK